MDTASRKRRFWILIGIFAVASIIIIILIYLALQRQTTKSQITKSVVTSDSTPNPAANIPTSTAHTSPTAPLGSTSTKSSYPLHSNITATVFWVGEPVGNGSSEDNAISAWDDNWQAHYGGYDDYQNRNGYFPVGFIPKENPFYLDLPYNDFNDDGQRRADAYSVVPWAHEKTWSDTESMMKNRWVKITKGSATCYGQIEDAGPYEYDDYKYVFGTAKPLSTEAQNAGLDVSPALRDCLHFNGVNNDENKVNWQFVNSQDVPAGPWKNTITTSLIDWE